MKDDLVDLKKKYPNYRLWVETALLHPYNPVQITGHSMGGSLASLTSLYLVKKGLYDPEKIRLVTFGEPRTGNVAYAKEMEKFVPFRYRIVKRNDPVRRQLDKGDGLSSRCPTCPIPPIPTHPS